MSSRRLNEPRWSHACRSTKSVSALVLLFASACGSGQSCQTCQPSQTGNLRVRSFGNEQFSATVAVDSVAYNQGQLYYAPFAPFELNVEVDYSDTLPLSTVASQKEIVVLARDPDEFEATLEGINQEGSTLWLDNTVAPFEPPDPNRTVNNAVTLPNAYGIPYPLSDSSRSLGSATTMFKRFFTGDDNIQFEGPAAEHRGSTKGLYVFQHGVCSYVINLRTDILDQIEAQVPQQLVDGINDGVPFGGQGSPQIEAFNLAAFVQRDGTTSLVGGFIQQLAVRVPFLSPPLVSDAVVARNFTYRFTLDNGVLSADPRKNAGGWDTGFFSGSIAGGIDDKLAKSLSAGIKLAALKKQFRAVPVVRATDPSCTDSSLSQKPASCFMTCNSVPDDPAQWPSALSASSPDDSSWYSNDYCKQAADVVLAPGVDLGAQAQGITDANSIAQLKNNLTTTQITDSTRLANVRCNFYPDYVASDPNQYGGKPRPVCEFAIRAKRINVFPDEIELVWFDAPSVGRVAPSEYTNEAFSVYLLAKAQGATGDLCARQSTRDARSRTFAHVSRY